LRSRVRVWTTDVRLFEYRPILTSQGGSASPLGPSWKSTRNERPFWTNAPPHIVRYLRTVGIPSESRSERNGSPVSERPPHVLIFNTFFHSSLLSSLIASRRRQTDHCLPGFRRKAERKRPHILHLFMLPMFVRELTEPTPNEPDGDGEIVLS
jgi:hypothetical protein